MKHVSHFDTTILWATTLTVQRACRLHSGTAYQFTPRREKQTLCVDTQVPNDGTEHPDEVTCVYPLIGLEGEFTLFSVLEVRGEPELWRGLADQLYPFDEWIEQSGEFVDGLEYGRVRIIDVMSLLEHLARLNAQDAWSHWSLHIFERDGSVSVQHIKFEEHGNVLTRVRLPAFDHAIGVQVVVLGFERIVQAPNGLTASGIVAKLRELPMLYRNPNGTFSTEEEIIARRTAQKELV